MTTNVYLTFNGNCEAAFNFYKSIFGGEFSYIGRFNEMPEADKAKMPEADLDLIMHVGLPIGSSMIMGSDCGAEWAPSFSQGNNFSISISADNKENADRIFSGLSQGGHVTMPLADTFWGDYFGMVTDQFGIAWMMSFNEQQKDK